MFGAGTDPVVAGASTTQHDFAAATPADVRMQQATVNLFADMGVQPATLQSGLVAATRVDRHDAADGDHHLAAAGASVANGTPVTITGTASDVGGRVGGVEVSSTAATTWHPATGRDVWTYAWTPNGLGATSRSARARSTTARNLGAASTGRDGQRRRAPTLTSIAVTPANPTVTVGGTQQFTATGTYSDGTTQGSDDPGDVGVVEHGGAADERRAGHREATGSTTISATLGAVSGSTGLTVSRGRSRSRRPRCPRRTVGTGLHGDPHGHGRNAAVHLVDRERHAARGLVLAAPSTA